MIENLAYVYNPVLNNLIGNAASYTVNSTGPVEMMLRNLINVAFGLGGAVFFIYLLWGGFAFITAGGDKDSIQKANSRIKTALIGIIILLSVFVIAWIIQTLFGVPILNFTVPEPTP